MDDDLQKAITFIKSGQKKQGGQILAEIVKQQPNNESAWLWLAHCVNTNQQKIYCLNKALEINPKNDEARKFTQKLQSDQEQKFQFTDNSPIVNQTNTYSIISLTTGLFGWAFVIIGLILSATLIIYPFIILATLSWAMSIIAGFVSLKQIKSKGNQKGDGLSKAGIILSLIAFVPIFCLVAGFFLFSLMGQFGV